MDNAILIDFGSTYTKLTCVDLRERRVVLTDRFASTVHTDARIGLHQCFDVARRELGEQRFAEAVKLSSSSAAGGLRMAVIGLTRTLSVVAGKNAAYGAGAKIMKNYFGAMTREQTLDLETSSAEIVLLCGGYEHGNRSMVLHNAKMLSESGLSVPVIYAGNSDAGQEVRTILSQGGKECFLVNNIIPAVGVLDIAPAEEIIRHIFMKRITNMMGMSKVQEEIGEILMPTPAAVLAAGTLLSQGTEQQEGIGPMMMVDVGGATTDVYSFNKNRGFRGSKVIGAPEPYAKRTVEGDMGMRESSICLLEEAGAAALARGAGVTETRIQEAIQHRITERSYLADTAEEAEIDHEIARQAVGISVRRHAGHIENVRIGSRQNQVGKNLTEIKTLIGTGGVIVNNAQPVDILRAAKLQGGESEDVLVPRDLEILTDHDYVFYAAGLLRNLDEDAALAIMKRSIGR